MAVRGHRKRALGTAVVGALLVAGGILAAIGVERQYVHEIAGREAVEAQATARGEPPPPGPTADLLRREIRVIPYLMHIFTWAGCLLLGMSVAALRGWRVLDPVAEQSRPPELS